MNNLTKGQRAYNAFLLLVLISFVFASAYGLGALLHKMQDQECSNIEYDYLLRFKKAHPELAPSIKRVMEDNVLTRREYQDILEEKNALTDQYAIKEMNVVKDELKK